MNRVIKVLRISKEDLEALQAAGITVIISSRPTHAVIGKSTISH